MYCKNCGAAVVGKFCSCCGTRVRSDIEEYRRAERLAQKHFTRNAFSASGDVALERLAEACWHAANLRYAHWKIGPDGQIPFDAFEKLETVKERASALFDKLRADF